jgi:hypothetical protein
MPQLSIYLDEETAALLDRAVSISGTSVSKWVGRQIRESLKTQWPDGYFHLFGSVTDPSFTEPEEPYQVNSTPRAEF